jgi:hypothetical protein
MGRLALVLCGLALTAAPAAGAPVDAAPGAEPYAAYCASCHGADGRGTGPRAAALAEPPADLTRLAPRFGSPLARSALLAAILEEHDRGRAEVCGDRAFDWLAPGAARSVQRRWILLSIAAWLDAQQEADARQARP